MLGLLGIAFAIWLLTRSGDNSTVIKSGDVPTTTGTRSDRSGSDEPTSGNYDYNTTSQEADNNPWTWAKPPAIFTKVPLSPGSRNRWLQLSRLWREYKEQQLDLHSIVRDAYYDAQERGGSSVNVSGELMAKRAQAQAIAKEIKRIAAIQERAEDLYKAFLVETFGTAQTNAYYAERKKEIAAGIWPASNTVIVPDVEKKTKVDPSAIMPDAGPATTIAITPMGARTFNTIDIERDAKLDAKLPGKRFTEGGGVYYEYRTNRSDIPGKAF
jgi:hypothetical protein